jgi:hypothetical protein
VGALWKQSCRIQALAACLPGAVRWTEDPWIRWLPTNQGSCPATLWCHRCPAAAALEKDNKTGARPCSDATFLYILFSREMKAFLIEVSVGLIMEDGLNFFQFKFQKFA